MAAGLQESTNAVEISIPNSKFDDDGRVKRTGTLMTASAHIITAVIGSGVLSLAWAIAQLGWIAGITILVIFSIITWFTSTLLADSYRSPTTGSRNYTYVDVVKAHLGGTKYTFCGLAQYGNFVGISIGYTITASISLAAIIRSNCFHKKGHDAGCHTTNNKFMIAFGVAEILLSQIPNFHELAGLSIIAAVMSFAYSLIGLGLSMAEIAGGHHPKTSLTGVTIGVDVTSSEKVWNSLQAIGNIAIAYTYSVVLVEIQDTLKSSPPENQVMKKASFVGVSVTTVFYMLCGTLGYAAFGNKAPGNFLTGFGFYEPFWLIDIGNICIVVHLVGAYQVFCQPIYHLVEKWCSQRWPESKFLTKEYGVRIPLCGVLNVNVFRLVWRTAYVTLTTVIAMIFPFFNSVLSLLGATSFWPLTVYFPIEMFISRAKIKRCSFTWIWLKLLSMVCLIISLIVAAASIQGLIKDLRSFKPFSSVS
ncbi:amino acid permease 6-like [Mangifera indica]|uniref:amino acid permease 6-like n=1 Tax=Mangifera indica TaxID=29780 RepID=UPI001CFAAC32|nr:amino acid permease 6-like [Mangifera indica]